MSTSCWSWSLNKRMTLVVVQLIFTFFLVLFSLFWRVGFPPVHGFWLVAVMLSDLKVHKELVKKFRLCGGRLTQLMHKVPPLLQTKSQLFKLYHILMSDKDPWMGQFWGFRSYSGLLPCAGPIFPEWPLVLILHNVIVGSFLNFFSGWHEL
jgi:hypothetical protein